MGDAKFFFCCDLSVKRVVGPAAVSSVPFNAGSIHLTPKFPLWLDLAGRMRSSTDRLGAGDHSIALRVRCMLA